MIMPQIPFRAVTVIEKKPLIKAVPKVDASNRARLLNMNQSKTDEFFLHLNKKAELLQNPVAKSSALDTPPELSTMFTSEYLSLREDGIAPIRITSLEEASSQYEAFEAERLNEKLN